MRANKREEVLNKKRNLLGMTAPPILMILVLLHENFDLYKVDNLLIGSDDSAVVKLKFCLYLYIINSCLMFLQRHQDFKQNLQSYCISGCQKRR